MPGGGESETVSKTELSKEQKKLLGLAMPMAEKYAKKPLQQYPGSTIPGFTPLQGRARTELLSAGKGIKGLVNTGTNTSTQGQAQTVQAGRTGIDTVNRATGPLLGSAGLGANGLGSILRDYNNQSGGRNFITSGAALDPNTNPATQGMISAALRPLQQQYSEQVMPGIRSNFIGGNSFGSTRQGIAEGIAARGLADASADATSSIVNNNYNQGLGAMIAGLGQGTQAASSGVGQGLGAGAAAGGLGASLAGTGMGNMAQILNTLPGLGNLSMIPGMTAEAIGESDRQLAGAKAGEAANRFNTQQMLPFMQAQQLAGLAFGMPGGSGTTTTGSNPSTGSQVTGGLSALATAMMMASMFSDHKLKRDIKFTYNDGKYNWYEFEYAYDKGTKHHGVMAHEVVKITPEAVQNIGGFQMVDYGSL